MHKPKYKSRITFLWQGAIILDLSMVMRSIVSNKRKQELPKLSWVRCFLPDAFIFYSLYPDYYMTIYYCSGIFAKTSMYFFSLSLKFSSQRCWFHSVHCVHFRNLIFSLIKLLVHVQTLNVATCVYVSQSSLVFHIFQSYQLLL